MPSSLKHELRTPLNHIIGYCEMLLEDAHDQSFDLYRPDLERIHAAGKRLLAVITDFYDPAKSPAFRNNRRLLDHEVRTPLNQIIGYAEMLQEEAQERGHDTLIPDLKRIHTAAQNLLQLVVEHVLPQTGALETQPGRKASGATAILRRIDESMTPASGLTGSLLVADDDPLNRDMLARRLVRLGHKVTLAENGREALEKIRAGSFDLLLLDIQMPEMTGYEVLEELKADPARRALPVIVLSASSESDGVARCIELGAEDHLPKPFDPLLLQARLGACLEKKFLRDREISYLRQLEEARQRSDALLHVILPHVVAEELRTTNAVRPRRFDRVGVLFCDVTGFTTYCDTHPPEEVHTHLQALVEAFEALTSQHGLEKIKTIGDAYMATAGLLSPVENPALACVRCGLAMIAAARDLPPHWQVRVGVHVGPVIAGVVGRRKYQYDVWGDTVNLAARMQSAAAPATLCVESATWQALAAHCRARRRGLIPIKGKGPLEVFQVEGLL